MLFHVENCKNKLYRYYYDFINWDSITTSEIFLIFNKTYKTYKTIKLGNNVINHIRKIYKIM
jgi:hypothetical protein